MRTAAALVLVALAPAARANTVSNEVIVSSAPASQLSPTSTVLTDALNASFNLNPDLTLTAGASIAVPVSGLAANPAGFNERASPVTFLSAGLDWEASDHWTVGAALLVSPPSTQFAALTDADGRSELRSHTSLLGAGIDVAWESFGRSDLEWSLNAGLDFTHYGYDQDVWVAGRSSPNLGVVNGSQDFERFSAAVTAIVLADTDVSLLGDYYLYNQDPLAAPNFRFGAIGRAAGLPIAPLRYRIRPEVRHQFGDLSAKLWVESGEYVSQVAQSTQGAGLRVQYRLSQAFRIWLTASGYRDLGTNGARTNSGTVSVGVGYRW